MMRGSDVFLKEDVCNILQALTVASEAAAAALTPAAGADALPYRQGFAAAIVAVATALGIPLDRRVVVQRNR